MKEIHEKDIWVFGIGAAGKWASDNVQKCW